MSTQARIVIAIDESVPPGTRAYVYADDGAGAVDYSTTIASPALVRSPAATWQSWGQTSWGQVRWGGGGELGWGHGVWAQSKWGNWQDSLLIDFTIPQRLVDLGGTRLFAVRLTGPTGVQVPTDPPTVSINVSAPTNAAGTIEDGVFV